MKIKKIFLLIFGLFLGSVIYRNFLSPFLLKAQDSNVTFLLVDMGLIADPCTGGAIQTVPALTGDKTLRYGDFSCRWALENDVLYRVKLNFVEPSQNGPSLRSFNVRINDQPVLINFDIFKSAGGYQKYLSRTFMVIGSGGEIKIDFQTVYRSALILSVEITSEITVRSLTFGSDGSPAKQIEMLPHVRLRGLEDKLVFEAKSKKK